MTYQEQDKLGAWAAKMLQDCQDELERGGYFDRPEPKPKARRKDPLTSHQAAARAARFADTHKGRIMAALGDRALTAHQIAEATGLTVVQVDRRLPELEESGMARPTGHVINGFRVWRCCDAPD